MAKGEPALTVILSKVAVAELAEVWTYNAQHYGASHAERYDSFLQSRIDALATEFDGGRPAVGRPELRQTVIRKGRKGHGHVVVYRVTSATVNVLHVFHTAQDVLEAVMHPSATVPERGA